ncbi:MAG: flippase [Bacteroidota bacterium]
MKQPLRGSYWFKSGAYTLVERLALQAFRFGTFYLLIRGLSREDFGIWTLFLIITTLVEVIRMGLIQNALIKFLARAPSHRIEGRIHTASLSLHFLVCILAGLVLFIMGQGVHFWGELPILDEMLYLYIFSLFALIPYYQNNFILQSKLAFKGIMVSSLVRQGVFFLYVLLAFWVVDVPLKLIHLAGFHIVSSTLASLVAIRMGKPHWNFSRYLDFRWLRWLSGYGKYVVGTNLGSMLIKTLDQLMLGSLLSPIATAIYSTAIKIVNLAEIPTQTAAAIVFPQSARRLETQGKPALKALYEKSVGIVLALIIPLISLIALFPEPIVKFIAGEAYLDVVPILRITLLYALFVPFSRQFGITMDALGKPKTNFQVVIFSAGLNALLNLIMIPIWGLMGAAVATLISLLMVFVLNQYLLWKDLGVQSWQSLKYAWKVYENGWGILRHKLFSTTQKSLP